VPVGEPAINPVPRRMIAAEVARIAAEFGGSGDLEVTISIPDGEAMARHTWAWIASIHSGIDVCRANGIEHAAACTGSTSEEAVKRLYGLPEIAFIDMGDFAGGTLKYLKTHPLPRLTIGGGFGKLVKLAAGSLDLHSGRSQLDREAVAEWLADLGAPSALVAGAATANTAYEILLAALQVGVPLGDEVAKRAQAVAAEVVDGAVAIEVIVFDREGATVGRAGFA
jgi:cobalt-precorrin-5B (C1)-methyltransferase